MKDHIVNDHTGKTVEKIEAPSIGGYQPTFCDIVFTDGSKLTVYASETMYDQYSSTPTLMFKER